MSGHAMVRVRFNPALMDPHDALYVFNVANLRYSGGGYELQTGLRDATWVGLVDCVDLEDLQRQAARARRRRGVIDVTVDVPGTRAERPA